MTAKLWSASQYLSNQHYISCTVLDGGVTLSRNSAETGETSRKHSSGNDLSTLQILVERVRRVFLERFTDANTIR